MVMAKLKTLAEKQEIRYRMVYIAFFGLLAIPATAFTLTGFGIDISSTTGIVSTVAASLSAIVIGFFATAPKDDAKEGFDV